MVLVSQKEPYMKERKTHRIAVACFGGILLCTLITSLYKQFEKPGMMLILILAVVVRYQLFASRKQLKKNLRPGKRGFSAVVSFFNGTILVICGLGFGELVHSGYTSFHN